MPCCVGHHVCLHVLPIIYDTEIALDHDTKLSIIFPFCLHLPLFTSKCPVVTVCLFSHSHNVPKNVKCRLLMLAFRSLR